MREHLESGSPVVLTPERVMRITSGQEVNPTTEKDSRRMIGFANRPTNGVFTLQSHIRLDHIVLVRSNSSEDIGVLREDRKRVNTRYHLGKPVVNADIAVSYAGEYD